MTSTKVTDFPDQKIISDVFQGDQKGTLERNG